MWDVMWVMRDASNVKYEGCAEMWVMCDASDMKYEIWGIKIP